MEKRVRCCSGRQSGPIISWTRRPDRDSSRCSDHRTCCQFLFGTKCIASTSCSAATIAVLLHDGRTVGSNLDSTSTAQQYYRAPSPAAAIQQQQYERPEVSPRPSQLHRSTNSQLQVVYGSFIASASALCRCHPASVAEQRFQATRPAAVGCPVTSHNSSTLSERKSQLQLVKQ